MKNPLRNAADIVEYKSTKRKKPQAQVDHEPVYSDRIVSWEEQRRLPKRFTESGEGTWPTAGIIGERHIGRKKEYLVSWEPHPETNEIWRPSWEPTRYLAPDLLAAWKRKKNRQPEPSPPKSNGHSLNQPRRKSKPVRTIPDSSSESAVQPSERSNLVPSFVEVPDIDEARRSTNSSSSARPTKPAPAATLEIPESQLEPSAPSPALYVRIPPTSIDKADYESYKSSSQVDSASGVSPLSQRLALNLQSRNGSSASQNGNHSPCLTGRPSQESARSGPRITPSTSTTPKAFLNGRNKPPVRRTPPRVAKSNHLAIREQSRTTAATPPRYPQPLTRHLPSSGTSPGSSRILSPDYIPSTERDATQPRPDIVGSATPRRRTFTIGELTRDLLPASPTTQNGRLSTPWEFQADALSIPDPQPSALVAASAHSKPRKLLDAFSSPTHLPFSQIYAMNLSPDASQTAGSAVQRDQVDAGLRTFSHPSPETKNDASGPSIQDQSSVEGSQHGPSEPEAATTSGGTVAGGAARALTYDVAMPIHKSIEEEPPSSGEQSSAESKTSSSQQSVDNERDVPQQDSLAVPSLPILGPQEYAIALPAEGKVQSTYFDLIKAKKRAILKFINRPESIGSLNGSPNRTHENNEMLELMQRLHDTTTHLDLGLPDFASYYSIKSQEHAAYANYAGSKFSFLGHLVDRLKQVGVSIVIVSQSGQIQDLLEQYLGMKNVRVRRQDRIARSESPAPDRMSTDFEVELVGTFSTYPISFNARPELMIAFDASFDAQDPQIMRIRRQFSRHPPSLLQVIHLLVSNSSEHVDRCLPKSLPSPIRLRALMRATYQARPHLGGKPTYVPNPSDEPDGRPMDFSDLNRALRKSPERKLEMLARLVARASIADDFDANWTLGQMPELQLSETEDLSYKGSGVSTVAETPREGLPRSRTPISRADTPSGRKRLMDVDGMLPALAKRQRLTPLQDSVEVSTTLSESTSQISALQELVNKLHKELATEKCAREKAEQERTHLQEQVDQWRTDHANLQRRYEKRMTKCHELDKANKKLNKTIEDNKARQERVAEDNAGLKKKVSDLQEELTNIRCEIKAGGGDAAAAEEAREESRLLRAKSTNLEKSLENTRKDFEFTRTQYQEASSKAAEFATQVRELEEKVGELSKQASDERRRLKETTFQDSIQRHLAKISEVELQRKSMETLLRKLEEENRQLKRNRGVQTRGSSVQPPGSPGMDGRGTRSRQASPAPASGLFPGHRVAADRGSLLRHER